MAKSNTALKLSDQEIAAPFLIPEIGKEYPPILTVDQVATLLQIPKATVYDWSSRGRFRGCSRRLGKRLRFWRDRLIAELFN